MMKLLKPASGEVTAVVVEDALSLVGIILPTNLAKEWTQEQRDQAYDYAIRLHLRASDNFRVRLATKPAFL
jgi:hypothetical protein